MNRTSFWKITGICLSLLLPLALETAFPIDLDSLRLELKGAWVENPADGAEKPGEEPLTIDMGLWTNGLPSRYVIKVESARVTLETQEGDRLAVIPRSKPSPLSSPDLPALHAALGDIQLFAPPGLDFALVPVYSLPRKTIKKYWSDFLRFSATLEFQAAEYRPAAKLPPQVGASALTGKVKSVKLAKDSLSVRIDGLKTPWKKIVSASGERVAILQNSKRKEALLGQPIFKLSRFSTKARPGGWTFHNADSPSGKLLTKAWLADAELVILELHKVTSFSRSFSLDPYQLSFDIPGQRGETSDYNPGKLEEIRFPDPATKAELRAYVAAILAVSKTQKRFGYEDPQVAMLMKVGPDNLDILMDAAPLPRNWKHLHIWKAMRELVTIKDQPNPGHRDLILSRLEANPDFAELLLLSGWTDEARPILLKGLQDERNDLSSDWITAIISFHDPETYPALTDYYLRNPTEPGLFESISEIPGIDLAAIMPVAWEKAKAGTVRQQSFVIHQACESGLIDALATAADWLRPDAGKYAQGVGRAVFKKYTPVEGENAELVAWFEINQARLAFDRNKKMFLPGP